MDLNTPPRGGSLMNRQIVNKYLEGGIGVAMKFVQETAEHEVSDVAARSSVDRLLKNYNSARKTPSKKELFLDTPYKHPVSGTTPVSKVKQLEAELESKSDEVISLKEKVQCKDKELKRKRAGEAYHRSKAAKLEKGESEDEVAGWRRVADNLHHENAELREKNKDLMERNKQLEDELAQVRKQAEDSSKDNGDEVPTYDATKGQYLPSFRFLVYDLLRLSVPIILIAQVIARVCQFLGKTAARLPCTRTVQIMNHERLGLSQAQAVDEVAMSLENNLTLYTDETSKFGKSYMGYHVSTSDHRFYVLGLRDIVSKSAKDTLFVLTEILEDLSSLVSGAGEKIMTKIKNTMSDRASTELKFHELLNLYRQKLLPTFSEEYAGLSDTEKQKVGRLNSFFCGLHSFVQVGEQSEQCLTQLQKDIVVTGSQLVKKGESGTVRCIKTVCKAVARGGDEKSGCYGDFYLYLEKHCKKDLKFMPSRFRGNRFCIVFFEASKLYHLRNVIIAYFNKKDRNQLLAAVYDDCKNERIMAGVRALGFVDKYITGPLWRKIENDHINVLDMPAFVRQMVDALEKEVKDEFASFFSGKFCPSDGEWVVKKDVLFEDLLKPDATDAACHVALGVIVPAIVQLLKKQYSLGENLEKELKKIDREETSSVIKHNKFAERVFAISDQLLRSKPNLRHLSLEAYVAYSLGRTSEWLKEKLEKDEVEFAKTVELAMQSRKLIEKRYRVRREEIRKQKLANQEAKRQEVMAKRLRKAQEREMIMKEILHFTLYQTVEEVSSKVDWLTGTTLKADALKAQLRFRKVILEQDDEGEDLFKFSKVDEKSGKRRQLTVAELSRNVKALVGKAREQQDRLGISGAAGPGGALEGKRFVHRLLKEDGSGEMEEYPGVILCSVPGYPDWWNMKYDDDKEDLYVERVQQEINEGTMRLID